MAGRVSSWGPTRHFASTGSRSRRTSSASRSHWRTREYEVEWVDVDPEDRSEVVRVSGQELVPVLVEGERVLTDSPVILEYLEERFPERPLYPTDPARRAELRTFIDWFNRVWKRPPNLLVAEELKAEPDPDRIAELAQQIAGALPLFEDLLAGRDYLFGDELSAADVIAFPVPEIRGPLGGRRRGTLPRSAPGDAAARRPLPAPRSLDPPDRRAAARVGERKGRKGASAPSCG